jgi:hypothetical protein
MTGINMRKEFLYVLAGSLAFFVLIVWACRNEYATPVTLNPAQEMQRVSGVLRMEKCSLKLPQGWNTRWTWNAKERPATDKALDCYRSEAVLSVSKDDSRIGVLTFHELKFDEECPFDSSSFIKLEMDDFDEAGYQIEEETPASGDDTPGSYRLTAYAVKGDVRWMMHLGFSHDIRPDLSVTANYLGIIQPLN